MFVGPFPTNFEVDLEEPHFAQAMEAMSARWRVILFDQRGSGLSDHHHMPDLEMRADDLRAVLDEVGSDSASWLAPAMAGRLRHSSRRRIPSV